MKSVKVFVPYGAVGLNCTEEAFEAGLAMKPDIISSDAGSTDSGPYYLGSGHGKYSIRDVKRDLKRMVLGADKLGIPMTIGSAGTCGSDEGVDMAYKLICEICEEAGIHKKIARIYSQQNAETLKAKTARARSPLCTAHRKSPRRPSTNAAPLWHCCVQRPTKRPSRTVPTSSSAAAPPIPPSWPLTP